MWNLRRCHIVFYFACSAHYLCTDFQSRILLWDTLCLRNGIIWDCRFLVLACIVSRACSNIILALFHKSCCNRKFHTRSWSGVKQGTSIRPNGWSEICCQVYMTTFVRLSGVPRISANMFFFLIRFVIPNSEYGDISQLLASEIFIPATFCFSENASCTCSCFLSIFLQFPAAPTANLSKKNACDECQYAMCFPVCWRTYHQLPLWPLWDYRFSPYQVDNRCRMHTFGYRALHVRYDLFLAPVSLASVLGCVHPLSYCKHVLCCLAMRSEVPLHMHRPFTHVAVSPQRMWQCGWPQRLKESRCAYASFMGKGHLVGMTWLF